MKSEVKLKLLLCIVRKEENDRFQAELDRLGFSFNTAALAEGTAKSEYLSMFGMSGPEKALFYTVGEETKIYSALAEISKNMKFDMPGGGIGLILPLTSICGRNAFDAILKM